MIIGNGMIAKGFEDFKYNNEVVIFASGVSNSGETSKVEFSREKDILKRALKEEEDKIFIYFGTCSVYDSQSSQGSYVEHKLKMEKIVQSKHSNYLIFRLPQVLGKNNKKQLVGFLFDKLKNDELFSLYDIERNIIDISDIEKIASRILKNKLFINSIVNIANPKNIKVIELVQLIEKSFNFKGRYDVINRPGHLSINIESIEPLIKELGLFPDKYIENCIAKYYAT